jgi:hypothetical protein
LSSGRIFEWGNVVKGPRIDLFQPEVFKANPIQPLLRGRRHNSWKLRLALANHAGKWWPLVFQARVGNFRSGASTHPREQSTGLNTPFRPTIAGTRGRYSQLQRIEPTDLRLIGSFCTPTLLRLDLVNSTRSSISPYQGKGWDNLMCRKLLNHHNNRAM